MLFLLSWPLLSLLGYVYPAYATYKTVERRASEPDDFRFWCKYWIIMAVVHVIESTLFFGLITWLPFYDVTKVIFCIYLWHPRTQGALLLYHRLIVPALSRHEREIDLRINEVQTRGMDLAVEYSRALAAKLVALAKQGAEAAPGVYQRYQSFAQKAPPPAQPATSTASSQSYSSGDLGEKIVGTGPPDTAESLRYRPTAGTTGGY
eukprot:TRINITY_DN4432_c0_g1_i1.p1 TRINITY_DN4432_c0_g1~~TRINITY_DN4432_c0_g1_i1.p1  ORF type:complete len:206 (-),score=6.81 TRINITY_DN4432_c0_g1_i1:257-874(-)